MSAKAAAKKTGARKIGTKEHPLGAYRARRRFDVTEEPRGSEPRERQEYHFVIQEHAARRLHYDFRLELDGVLKSWAVTRGPSLDPGEKRLAVRVEDHPLEYGSFEGTIPQGEYGGGTVMLWDQGRWTPEGDPQAGLERGKLAFTLDGEKLHGKWALVRMRARAREKRENWLLIKENDAFANRKRDVLKAGRSVASGRSLDEIAKGKGGQSVWSQGQKRVPDEHASDGTRGKKTKPKPKREAMLPAFVEPQLARLVDAPPEGDGWIFEIKYDGYRAQIAADGEAVRIYARSGGDWSDKFPPVVAAVQALGLDRALLDTEIVALDEQGRSDFSLLQRWWESQEGELACFVFDLLAEGGRDLRKETLTARKERLRALLAGNGPEGSSDRGSNARGSNQGPIFYSEDFRPEKPAMLLKESCRRGLEGLIAKQSDGPYRAGRGPLWLKIKCGHQQEFVIIGWSRSSRRLFSSVLLAVREGDALRYVGRVGSGFSDAMLEELSGRFAELATDRPPASVPKAILGDANFVEPKIVIEVRFAGWTQDNLVRQGHVLGIREDKPALEVTREVPVHPRASRERRRSPARRRSTARPAGDAGPEPSNGAVVAGITLSHPEKLLYSKPAVTKADVARYLDAVGKIMAPYSANRLVSLVRCPKGQGGQVFFQRHPHAGLERYWHSLAVETGHGHEDYLYFKDRRALVEAAQMDTLEFHIWGSGVDDIEHPDRIVFDLDPAPSVGFEQVKEGAGEIRAVLDALGLQSLPMITGGKGIHVVVPIARRSDWAMVKGFAGGVASRLTAAAPQRYIATMSKAKRKDRIFIDAFRNDRAQTAIAPFSPRNRPGAPVAWPLDWDGLAKVTSADAVSIFEAAERLAATGDPWTDYAKIRQALNKRMIGAVDSGD